MITLEELCKKLPTDRSKFIGAYVLTHAKTGALYIGSSGDLTRRMKDHLFRLKGKRHENSKLQDLYDKDPCFHVFTYLTEDREKAYECEQQLMDHHVEINSNLLNNSLNSRFVFANRIYQPMSQDSRSKISESVKKIWTQPGYAENHKIKLIEKFKDPEFKKKMHEAYAKRRPFSKEDLEKLRARKLDEGRRLSINGVIYRNTRQASRDLKLAYSTIYNRCLSKNNDFQNWYFL